MNEPKPKPITNHIPQTHTLHAKPGTVVLNKVWKRLDVSFTDDYNRYRETTIHNGTLALAYQVAVMCGFSPSPWWKVWDNRSVNVFCIGEGEPCAEYELFDEGDFEEV